MVVLGAPTAMRPPSMATLVPKPLLPPGPKMFAA